MAEHAHAAVDGTTVPHAATHHYRLPPPQPPEGVPMLLSMARGRGAANLAILVCGVLTLIGIVALVLLILQGPEPRAKWGYITGATAWVLCTAGAAPIFAWATRLAKGFWAIPVRRAADLWAVTAIVTVPLLIILELELPSFQGRPSIWFDWPGSPQVYDIVFFVALGILGLAILYFSHRPDRLTMIDRGLRQGARGGWLGTNRQWLHFTGSLILLGAMYIMTFAYSGIFMVSDLGMSLVPSWHSAIYPAYVGVSSLQGALAIVILTAWGLRRWGGLDRFIGLDVFWGAAKLLLATSLLFFYFSWNEFIIYWYGRTPEELALLGLLMFQSARALFIISFLCNFVIPWLLLIWNYIRVSTKGPPLVALFVIIGNLVDRLRIFGASWSVAGPVGQKLDPTNLPPLHVPGILEILVVIAIPAASVMLYLLSLRRFTAISLWEYRYYMLHTVERTLLRLRAYAIAKPT